MRSTSPPAEQVAGHFGLGSVIGCTPITEGLMNPNWRLSTTGGTYAVKQLRDATPSAGRRQQSVLPVLAARGLPVPSVTGAEVDGHYYLVAPWMPGAHRTGSDLTLDACHGLGDLVGQIHSELRELLPAPPSVADEPRTVDDARADLERLDGLAAAGRDDFDVFARAEIGRRLRLLDEIGHLRPPDDPDVRPAGWTHGDLTDLNLLFDGDTVSGVLDWDRLAVRPYGLEVVRTASVLFEVGDRARTAAFAAGSWPRPARGGADGSAARRLVRPTPEVACAVSLTVMFS